MTTLFHAHPEASSFLFAVRHSGVFRFRGAFTDVTATLTQDGDTLELDGTARADSITITEPEAMRASLLGPSFFDVELHPELWFRSTGMRVAPDGDAEVDGDLTLRGVTLPVSATGRYGGPRVASFGEVAGLQLATTIDRRTFGFDWQAEMPDGGDAVGWDVEIEIDLLLVRAAEEAA
jgi:polyisoprenoid-binding protein YceI